MISIENNKLSFIKKAKLKHGSLYEYEDVVYINFTTPVYIFCKRCKKFFNQSPRKHLDGRGCKKCNNILRIERLHNRDDREKFIEKAVMEHDNIYCYEKVDYVNSLTKVEIYCKKCDKTFFQSPSNHISGKGCVHCRNKMLGNRSKYTFDTFLSKLSNHQICNYTYDEIEFEKRFSNKYNKMKIYCNKCKKEFHASIATHIKGHGCPICNRNGGKNEIKLYNEILNRFDLHIIKQYRPNFLKRQSIDLFIPSLELCIEYQGIQHFKPIEYFGGTSSFDDTIERDFRKNNLCKENGLNLLYFTYDKNIVPEDHPYEILSNIEELIKIIENKINENENRLERHCDSSE
jgi:Zn finger protein HypA/HybF involved in hydrogenase expression